MTPSDLKAALRIAALSLLAGCAVCGVVVMAVFGAVSFCFFALLAWYWAAFGLETVRGRLAERRQRNRDLASVERQIQRGGALAAVRNGSVT